MAANSGERSVKNPIMPVDEPVLERPGVMHRETDYQGNDKFYALPPESKERARKGDLGNAFIKDFEPRPLTHKGLPFVIKEK